MGRADLLRWLHASRIRRDAYDLDGGDANETYVLRAAADGWETFYRERGVATGRRTFTDEADACRHLRALIEADPSTRMT